MKNKKKKRKNPILSPRCPYCGSSIVFRSAEGIYKTGGSDTMLYVCKNYPQCDAYVRVHPGTHTPVGTLANHRLRTLRRVTHHYFDKLYEEQYMSKQEAYQWLANLLECPLSEAHIGYLGEYYCQKVLEESKKLLTYYRKLQISQINRGKVS